MGKKNEITQFGSIFLVHLGIKETIDWVLNPILMFGLGYTTSFLVTTLLYVLLGVVYLKIYILCKNYLVVFEDLKTLQSVNLEVKEKIIIRLILKMAGSDKLLLVILLYLKNPGLFVIYLRKNSKFTETKIKVISGLYLISISLIWNLMVYWGISAGKTIWNFIINFF